MAKSENPVDALAAHVAATTYSDLPPAAVEAAKTFLLDTLGVAVAGSADPWARRLARSAARWGSGEEATVWVEGMKLPAPSAALVNAYFIHCLEFDCVHEGAVVHPMTAVLPALFAYGEREGMTSGKELLLAVVLGVEVATRIGLAATGPMRFFRPAMAGAFGATAALAKLRGFGQEETANALGAVYGQISGTLQPHLEGTPLLAMQMGFNARAAITAVDLTTDGLRAPRDFLVGRYGFYSLFEGGAYDAARGFADLGREWQVTRLAHKPFPSGRLAHGGVDGVLKLQALHGFRAEAVESVTVRVPPLVYRLVGREDLADPSPNYARLCLRFIVATALLRGTVDVPDFNEEWLRNDAVHELARRIEVVEQPNRDENAFVPQEVEVWLRDGAIHTIRLDRVLGSPDSPLSSEQHLEKFRRNWGYGARPLPDDAAQTLVARVEALEEVADMRELVGLLTAASPS